MTTEPLSAEEVERVREMLLNGSVNPAHVPRLLASIDYWVAANEDKKVAIANVLRQYDEQRARAEAAEAERDRLDATNDRFGEAAEHLNQRIRSLEAERDRYKAALEEMLARHPDAIEGEHPAVDLARRALALTTEGTE